MTACWFDRQPFIFAPFCNCAFEPTAKIVAATILCVQRHSVPIIFFIVTLNNKTLVDSIDPSPNCDHVML
jgi:hypothetical protein